MAYMDYAIFCGVKISFKSSIRSWNGWPEDVVETVRRWNHKSGGHNLTFGYLPQITRSDTGFNQVTFKCVRCDGFFNAHGSTACVLDGKYHCDDCIIRLARAGEGDENG